MFLSCILLSFEQYYIDLNKTTTTTTTTTTVVPQSKPNFGVNLLSSFFMIDCCETMAKLAFRVSDLKNDLYQYIKDCFPKPILRFMPPSFEDVEHIIIHCLKLTKDREVMNNDIAELE